MLLLQHCALRMFHMTDGQNTGDQITKIEVPNMHDQSEFCTFHTFLVEVQTNAGYMHAMHA